MDNIRIFSICLIVCGIFLSKSATATIKADIYQGPGPGLSGLADFSILIDDNLLGSLIVSSQPGGFAETHTVEWLNPILEFSGGLYRTDESLSTGRAEIIQGGEFYTQDITSRISYSDSDGAGFLTIDILFPQDIVEVDNLTPYRWFSSRYVGKFENLFIDGILSLTPEMLAGGYQADRTGLAFMGGNGPFWVNSEYGSVVGSATFVPLPASFLLMALGLCLFVLLIFKQQLLQVLLNSKHSNPNAYPSV